MNRRKFLLALGSAGVASTLVASPETAGGAGTANYPYYPESYGVLHDSTRCIGCRRCEKSCRQVNNLPMPAKPFEDLTVLDVPRRTTADAWTVVNKYAAEPGKVAFRKLQCLHCNDPACASACFAKCFTKNPDGSVTYNGDQCVGCRYCMVACPFYVPGFQYYEAYDPLVLKCTFCAPRLREGKLPGCVEGCPMDALTFGKRRDLVKIARKRIESEPERYFDYIYGEHDAGGAAWMTIAGAKPDMLGQDTRLGNRPMGELTAGALGSVPMIIGFWPVLFAGMYGVSKLKEAKTKQAQAAAVGAVLKADEAVLADIEKEQGAEAAAKLRRAIEEARKAACVCGCPDKHGEGA